MLVLELWRFYQNLQLKTVSEIPYLYLISHHFAIIFLYSPNSPPFLTVFGIKPIYFV